MFSNKRRDEERERGHMRANKAMTSSSSSPNLLDSIYRRGIFSSYSLGEMRYYK
jgi:hypothetical protein